MEHGRKKEQETKKVKENEDGGVGGGGERVGVFEVEKVGEMRYV